MRVGGSGFVVVPPEGAVVGPKFAWAVESGLNVADGAVDGGDVVRVVEAIPEAEDGRGDVVEAGRNGRFD